jgi:hypothetical protein
LEATVLAIDYSVKSFEREFCISTAYHVCVSFIIYIYIYIYIERERERERERDIIEETIYFCFLKIFLKKINFFLIFLNYFNVVIKNIFLKIKKYIILMYFQKKYFKKVIAIRLLNTFYNL